MQQVLDTEVGEEASKPSLLSPLFDNIGPLSQQMLLLQFGTHIHLPVLTAQC